MRKPINDFFLFLIGGALFSVGLFLFTNQVMVDSGFRSFGWRRVWGGWGGFFSFGAGQGFAC